MIGTFLIATGLALLLLGGVGMLRFRDPYARLQASGVGDIGGAAVFLLGVIAHLGWEATGGILIALIAFLLVTGPLSTHAIAKGAFLRGVRPRME